MNDYIIGSSYNSVYRTLNSFGILGIDLAYKVMYFTTTLKIK